MTDESDFPVHLTFSQRYGYEPLPEPMKLEEISDDLRREIWMAIKEYLHEIRRQVRAAIARRPSEFIFSQRDMLFLQRVFSRHFQAIEPDVRYRQVVTYFYDIILQREFNVALDLLEHFVNDRESPEHVAEKISRLFRHYSAPYSLNLSRRPYRFMPSVTKEQGQATQQAFDTITKGGMDGSASHLRQAAEHINARQYADAIADCIHAVESIACVIDPKSNNTLGPALDSLERAGVLRHPALKDAFKKLYGYASDEQGIRHALLDQDAADVGLDEALFMFGACASFTAYLTQKHRQAGGA